MIACDRCEEWFHPACLNINLSGEIEMNSHLIFCLDCLDYFHKEYNYYPEREYEKLVEDQKA